MLRTLRSFAAAAVIATLAACSGGSSSSPASPSPPALSSGQPPGQPASMSISGIPATPMPLGQSAQLTTTRTYADASTKDVTATATWSSTDATVLSVSSGGVIVAVVTGQAEVLAAAEGQSTRGAVRVSPGTSRLALVAGSLGGRGYFDGAAAQARFTGTTGIAANSTGDLFVADTDNSVIRRVSASGEVSTVAGAARVAGSVDGPAAEARFNRSVGIAVGVDGSLHVADAGNHTIRRITPSGIVITMVGTAGRFGFAPGALPGGLTALSGIAFTGTSLYIATLNGIAQATDLP